MKEEMEKGFDLETWGIILAALIVIVSIVWIAILNLSKDDDGLGKNITWVG